MGPLPGTFLLGRVIINSEPASGINKELDTLFMPMTGRCLGWRGEGVVTSTLIERKGLLRRTRVHGLEWTTTVGQKEHVRSHRVQRAHRVGAEGARWFHIRGHLITQAALVKTQLVVVVCTGNVKTWIQETKTH